MDAITLTVSTGTARNYNADEVEELFKHIKKSPDAKDGVRLHDLRGTAKRFVDNRRGGVKADPDSVSKILLVKDLVRVQSYNAVGPYERMAAQVNGMNRVVFIREDKLLGDDLESVTSKVLCVDHEWIQ